MKKSIKQAHLENGTFGQILSHFESELELNGSQAPDELQNNTVTQQTTQQKSEKSKPLCHHCRKPGHYQNQCRQLKRGKDQARKNTNSADNKNKNNGGCQTNSNSNNKASNNTNANNTIYKKDRGHRPVYTAFETCGKTNHSTQQKSYFAASAANRPPPRNRRPEGQHQVQRRSAKSHSVGNVQAAAQTLNQKRHVFTLELHLTNRR